MRRLLPLILLLFVACGGDDPAEPESNIAPGKIQPTTGPYVSVAVDNHFHDVHPDESIQIQADRPFVVDNQGRNLHNVTFPTHDIDEDIRPGEEFRIDRVGELGLGVQQFFCKYHPESDMKGIFTVVEG